MSLITKRSYTLNGNERFNTPLTAYSVLQYVPYYKRAHLGLRYRYLGRSGDPLTAAGHPLRGCLLWGLTREATGVATFINRRRCNCNYTTLLLSSPHFPPFFLDRQVTNLLDTSYEPPRAPPYPRPTTSHSILIMMASPQEPGYLGRNRSSRPSVSDPTGLTESTARSDSTCPTSVVGASQNQRNEGWLYSQIRNQTKSWLTIDAESWVEVASQPSSSSLSSMGDEIVTTGLHVANRSYPPQRRRLQHHYHQSLQQHMQPSRPAPQAVTQAGTSSSQEEYDETESEEDRMLTSSTENMDTRPARGSLLQRSQTAIGPSVDSSDSEDDDGTALGTTHNFRPQPHVFSRPHAHLSHRSHSTNSAIPPHHPQGRPSPTSYRSSHRARDDFRSPNYQADNDAALRASLTTLLSCAAAAKSLPGRRGTAAEPSSGEPVLGAGVGQSSQPMDLRLVPESEIGLGEGSPPIGPTAPKITSRTRQAPATTRTSSNSSAQSVPVSASSKEEKIKRTAATSQSKSQRATKKKRTSTSGVEDNFVTWISPTTLTWVLGTGVVLLVSVVGFGAGFVVGREIGRQEVLSSTGGSVGAGLNSSSCGGDVIRSSGSGTLRRWRLGAGMGRSVVA